MTVSHAFPSPGYDGPIDWNDLSRDFSIPAMFFDGISLEDLRKRIVGTVPLLVLPYRGMSSTEQGRAVARAHNFRLDLMPMACALSPALDFQCMLTRGAFNPANGPTEGEVWQQFLGSYFAVTDPVIILPAPGYETSRELYQIAGSALSSNRKVYLLKEEDL